jgi:NitT/TauT family transport system substrate-binding protein
MCRLSQTVLLALFLLGTVSHAAKAFTIIVTERDTPLVPNSIIQLAKRLGYFDRAGVNVDITHVSGTPLAVAALAAGQGDLANVSLSSLLNLTKDGAGLFRAVAVPSKSMSYVIAASDSVASVADLRGKVFGIGQVGTLDDTLTRTVLDREGINPEGIRMMVIGAPRARLAALAVHEIDATTISYASWMALPDKSGLHILLSKDRFFGDAPAIAKVNIVPAHATSEKRAETVKISAALVTIARDFAREPNEWSIAMRKARPDVPKATLEALASSYAGDWCVNGCFDRGELIASATLLAGRGAAASISEWADFSVLRDALVELDRRGGK